MSLKRFDQLVDELRSCLAGLCDKRTGTNTQYTMQTIGLSAFSVFFSQCPSFLAHQKAMQHNKGQSNAANPVPDRRHAHAQPRSRHARSRRTQSDFSGL